MTVMVELIGEQPLPNLLPVRYDRPDSVLLLYTSRTCLIYERLRETLQRTVTVYGLETDAYNIPAIAAALQQQLKAPEYRDQPLVFNVTGGTKAMLLAAYQVADQQQAPILYLQSEGKGSWIHRYQWEQRQLRALPPEKLPACIDLKDFLDVHLGPQRWQQKDPSKDQGSRFEQALATALESAGYEVLTGIKAMDGQIDIDIAVRLANQFGIIEAKTGKKGQELDGIKQLNSALRHLGTYTKAFYVITVAPEQRHEAISTASRIRIVSLPDFDKNSATLSPTDTNKLIAAVDQELK